MTTSRETILQQIRDFHKKNGRIPLKREFKGVKAAQRRFTTWNNAIKAAGFDPNPVKFAKKYIANDGHKCDSLAEKIIDDWLFYRNIPHIRSVPYGINNMTADFKVKDKIVEFFGLKGEHEDYDRLVEEKKRIWKEKKLQVIEVFPNDLFPINKLGVVLSDII